MEKRIKCDKCGREFYESCVTQCPHPAVNRRYGKHICMYHCKKCIYSKKVGIDLVCTYKEKMMGEQ